MACGSHDTTIATTRTTPTTTARRSKLPGPRPETNAGRGCRLRAPTTCSASRDKLPQHRPMAAWALRPPWCSALVHGRMHAVHMPGSLPAACGGADCSLEASDRWSLRASAPCWLAWVEWRGPRRRSWGPMREAVLGLSDGARRRPRALSAFDSGGVSAVLERLSQRAAAPTTILRPRGPRPRMRRCGAQRARNASPPSCDSRGAWEVSQSPDGEGAPSFSASPKGSHSAKPLDHFSPPPRCGEGPVCCGVARPLVHCEPLRLIAGMFDDQSASSDSAAECYDTSPAAECPDVEHSVKRQGAREHRLSHNWRATAR